MTRAFMLSASLSRTCLSRASRCLLSGAMIASGLAIAACPQPANAHQAAGGWTYDPFCCNGNDHTGDCQMIPTKNVKIVKDGYEIIIGPGDHRMITHSHDFRLQQSEARRSQDSDYHLCLYPNEDTLRCFYAPDMSY